MGWGRGLLGSEEPWVQVSPIHLPQPGFSSRDLGSPPTTLLGP